MTEVNQSEIISIGTEILMGEITDTNAGWLAGQLCQLGIELGRITTARDNKTQLTEVFREAIVRSNLIISSGGLGPTDDDLTRECLAEALGENLAIDTQLEQALRRNFERWHRTMPLNNLQQAMIIPSARGIPNPHGTAPGWWVEKNGRTVILLPGPPREMEPMWRNEVRPHLQAKFVDRVLVTRTLKVYGMGESQVNEMIAPFFKLENPTLGIYARPDGIHLRLIARGLDATALVDSTDRQMTAILGNNIWGRNEDTLTGIIGKILDARGLTLATFEDGTRGNLSAMINQSPASLVYYRGGIVAATDGAKVDLGLPADVIQQNPISAPAAEALADLARIRFKADIGLGITGIGGLDNSNTPAEISFIAVSDRWGKETFRQSFLPRRDMMRGQAAIAALFRLRQRLMETR